QGGVFCCTVTCRCEGFTVSLHDALPIWRGRDDWGSQPGHRGAVGARAVVGADPRRRDHGVAGPRDLRRRRRGSAPTTARAPTAPDRKSTRLNSSHLGISYAVFCLKKKIF